MKWGLRGVWHCTPSFGSLIPPPSNVILGVPTSTQTRTLCAQKVSWKRPRIQYHFWSILDPISDDFWLQNPEKNNARLIYLSSSVSKLIFASNSLDPSVVEKSKNLQNTWTVVQKSTLRISELREKYNLLSVRIWYQNLSFLEQNSIPKVHLKQTSSIEAVLVSKVFQNDAKKGPKCLIGTEKIDLGTPLARSSGLLGLKDTSTAPQVAHFDLIWKPTGPHFLPLQAVLTSLRGQFS